MGERSRSRAAARDPASASVCVPGKFAFHQELSRYRYCTGFVVEGDGLDMARLERQLGQLGDSLLVVGDEEALKVHLHTDDPGAAISAATSMGLIGRVEIADMHVQIFQREGHEAVMRQVAGDRRLRR